MSRDTVLKDADGVRYSYDNLVTQGYLNGQPVGVDAAAAFLKREATKLFEAGNDSEAVAMRNLAERMLKEVRPLLSQAAVDHERSYPACLDDKSRRSK